MFFQVVNHVGSIFYLVVAFSDAARALGCICAASGVRWFTITSGSISALFGQTAVTLEISDRSNGNMKYCTEIIDDWKWHDEEAGIVRVVIGLLICYLKRWCKRMTLQTNVEAPGESSVRNDSVQEELYDRNVRSDSGNDEAPLNRPDHVAIWMEDDTGTGLV